MAIAAVATQAGVTATNNSATGARSWTTNVTAGSLIIICASRYSASNDAFVAGDCAKTAGTSTIGAVSLDSSAIVDTDASVYAIAGIWSAIVTGSGSLTMTVTGQAGDFWLIGGDEYTGSWDGTRVEDFASATSTADNTVSASSGNADSAGAALFVGAMSINNPGNNITITPDGAFTQIGENENQANMQGSFIRQITVGATTDAADWTLSGNSIGWSAAVAVYREAAGGGTPPALTDVDSDEAFASNATAVTFTGTDLGADETARDVFLVQGAVEVEQTQGSGDDTGGTFDVVGFGLGGLLKYGVATTLKVVTADGEDELSVTISPPSGYAYVDLASIHGVEAERITAVPDLEVGDQLEYETVGDKVEILDDATFTVDDETVTEFDVRAFDTAWGAAGTQEIVIDDGTAPDAFAFTDQTDVELSTVCTSAPVTIEGVEAANSPITISGGEYSINGGAFTSDAGTVEDGDEVRARVTSSSSYETGVTATVTIGGVSDGFTATTRAQVAPTITTTTLAGGNVGSAYSRTIVATGDGPFTWAVTVGTLPDGLALDADTGVISGTPTTIEDQTFTVEATNDAGSDDQELSISIGAELEGGCEVVILRRRRRC